ncbi:ATP-dependent DNA helicase PIF1-like protein, partial [Tanacetum coccineum]
MIEAERMSFNRKQQKVLRSETYSKLAKLTEDPESGVQLRGKKVVLSSSFTGSPSLMKDLKERHIFGRVKGAVYTIEFQKIGLPHCHILLWLEHEDKITTTAKIDKYISAEIPNKNEDPELYQIVTDHMMHGPCGADNPSCPCTVDFKCTKKFPKQFNETTVIDDKGYAIYKRRNDGNTITKSGTDLHNGYVVSYNAALLKRYQSHINVEWCNQIGSIKYLFKYINKGPDRVTAGVDGEEVDEIKDLYDCRYLSACESAWQIYGFDIHYRTPPVERLPFHLQDEQSVIFDAIESIDYTLEKSSVNETKFIQWMELNKTDDFASTLLYAEIPKGPDRVTAGVDGEEVDEIKDLYDCRYLSACESAWQIYGFDIHYRTPPVERLPFHLQDEQSVIFDAIESIDYTLEKSSRYPNIMFGIHRKEFGNQDKEVKGLKEWSELKTFKKVVYPTYRDACYARGLLQDDKEYIDGLLEASQWGTGDYLRSFFVMLLITDSMSRPEFVWEKTWHVMAADVENVERIKQNKP